MSKSYSKCRRVGIPEHETEKFTFACETSTKRDLDNSRFKFLYSLSI